MSSPLIERLLSLKKTAANVFASEELYMPAGARGVYGGLVVAQALMAAFQTIPDLDFLCHSCHSYFLLAGKLSEPIHYVVENIRDGKSFCTRRVTAYQGENTLNKMFIFEGSFQKPEPFYAEYQKPMPSVPPPECLPSYRDVYTAALHDPQLSPVLRPIIATMLAKATTMEQKPCTPVTLQNILAKKSVLPPVSRIWMRPYGLPMSNQTPRLHQATAAYASDHLLFTSLLPFGLSVASHELSFMTSLDHSIYFHCPFKADDWFLFETECLRVTSSRALVSGRMYSPDGKLFLSCMQDGLFRTKPLQHGRIQLDSKAKL